MFGNNQQNGNNGNNSNGQNDQQQSSNNQPQNNNANPPANGQNEKPANPLDFYAGIFDNTNNGQKKEAPKFSIPKDKLSEAAKSMDFMTGIDPALMDKAKTGDVGSIMQMMNEVARNAYTHSLDHTSSLSDSFINQRLSFENESLSGKMNNHLTKQELGNTTANFNNPVVKAQMVEFSERLAQKYPDASPVEIAAKTKDYFIELARAMTGDQGNTGNQEQNGGREPSGASVNWEDYLFKQ
jgi:hypothetical protein